MSVPSHSLLFWVQMNAFVKKGQLNASVPVENIWYLQVCSIIHFKKKKKKRKPDGFNKVLFLMLLQNPALTGDLETELNG